MTEMSNIGGETSLSKAYREEALQIAHEYAIDPACRNFPGDTHDSGYVISWIVRRDEFCGCRFCATIIPALKRSVSRRSTSDINLITASSNASRGNVFGPLSFVFLLTDGFENLQLYRPTVDYPVFIAYPRGRYLSTLRRVQKDPSSPECFNLARHWLRNCTENHEACKLPYEAKLPKRVLKISATKGNPTVCLVTDSSLRGDYSALSHCWGKAKFLRLLTTNLTSLERDVPWETLSKTFQDAIKVSLELGISIIWIDSLCILQDSREDWEEQAALMADVYRNAVVVIAANSGSGAHEGFLNHRKGQVDERIVLPEPGAPELYARTAIHHYNENITDYDFEETLSERGWTYQERLLARRYLSFNKKELHWECESGWRCECGQSEWMDTLEHEFSLRKLCGPGISKDEAYRTWRDVIVPRYSSRKLTVASDKLPALSAVAQAFGDHLQDTYLAGIWKGNIVESLCWEPKGWRHEARVSKLDIAPSWSWTSLLDCSQYGGPIEPLSFTPYSECLKAECEPSGQNRLGEVKNGFITLRGPFVKAFIGFPTSGVNHGPSIGLWRTDGGDGYPLMSDRMCIFNNDTPLQLEDGTMNVIRSSMSTENMEPLWESSDGDPDGAMAERVAVNSFAPVWCLHLGVRKHAYGDGGYAYWSYALVLGNAPRNPGCFIRLGISRIKSEHHSGVFEGSEVAEVTIV
ncbi:heterokaryon incompatibility protein-domain-containing protein [Fusarium tricinctum]|uniref:Heterokaryon incompatibility protein-domain-containing protein n=1 Tax=Fusarium tricinctum TaxID=61284 RepID=A0A8K0S9N1_9HYPO|nr:heterokaryon incompatibility protein-domain-containing protein [Fusarium tricinctum]